MDQFLIFLSQNWIKFKKIWKKIVKDSTWSKGRTIWYGGDGSVLEKKITHCWDWKKKKNHQTWGVKKKKNPLLPKAVKQKNSIRPQNPVVKW